MNHLLLDLVKFAPVQTLAFKTHCALEDTSEAISLCNGLAYRVLAGGGTGVLLDRHVFTPPPFKRDAKLID
jgi:hypothetical protein